MAVIIHESGMKFGEYEENQVFQLENSRQYTKTLSPHGVKSCEFILCRNDKLYFVEAKTSCPRHITATTPEEKTAKYNEYIHDIVLKMQHSLALYANILLERYTSDGVPDLLKKKDLSDLEIILLLVVKNAENEWLAPFQDVFRTKLRNELRIWKIRAFNIINETTARNKGFII
ncbi:MAG: hypothetical protein HFG64_10390 [Lachnospiraceae bacterium]|nr:hypothetical protein [Lachnospiraceae bacterium]